MGVTVIVTVNGAEGVYQSGKARFTVPRAPEKLAVTVLLPFIVMVAGLVLPLRSPLQELKLYPALGVAVAVKVTIVPALYVPPAGFRVTIPAPEGLTEVVRVYVIGVPMFTEIELDQEESTLVSVAHRA